MPRYKVVFVNGEKRELIIDNAKITKRPPQNDADVAMFEFVSSTMDMR